MKIYSKTIPMILLLGVLYLELPRKRQLGIRKGQISTGPYFMSNPFDLILQILKITP